MSICRPQAFYTAFTKSWGKHTPPWKREPPLGPDSHSTPWTRWAEDCMLEIANNEAGLHCQNRVTPKCPGEWMDTDHVFVQTGTGTGTGTGKESIPSYDSFPLIAVEHENGEFSGKDGELPSGNQQYASIEWAFWKVLSMRSKLSVLVAYSRKKEEHGKDELQKMIEGWCNTYSCKSPNVLVLIGWHDGSKFTEDEHGNIYSAYCVDGDLERPPTLQVITSIPYV